MFSKMVSAIKNLTWGTTTRKMWTIIIVGLLLASLLVSIFFPVPPPHVALSGEQIFSDGPAWLTNSVLMTILVDIFLLLLAIITRLTMKEIPGGLQNVMEGVVEALYGLAESVAGKNAGKFFPWVGTIFLFVIISNWSGLIPGVGSIGVYQPVESHSEEQPAEGSDSSGFRWDGQLAMAGNSIILTAPESAQAASAAAESEEGKFVPLLRAPSADLNMTFALAIATMVMVQIWVCVIWAAATSANSGISAGQTAL